MLFCKSKIVLNKQSISALYALPSADELRQSLANGLGSEARQQLLALFDEETFVEVGAYTKRGFSDFFSTEKADEFEGVITGYGAIDGKLVFAFVEDASRMGGVIDERHATKIANIYDMAIKNGAPIVGVFNSTGADVFAGTTSLAAYAKIMKCVSRASGLIPQIAYADGNCIGTCCAIAAMFDFVVKNKDAHFYVANHDNQSKNAENFSVAYEGTKEECLTTIRSLISFLPDNASVGADVLECSDNLNRTLGELDFGGEALAVISTIADNGVFMEVCKNASDAVSCAFTTIGGVKCGVVASSFAKNEGRIDAQCARKIAKFVTFCDAFAIPVVTLVDSLGLAHEEAERNHFAEALSDLAYAYATSDCPMVTVLMGHAIGGAFALLGSKALGADVVYVLDNAEVGALNAECGVAFAWDKYITEEVTREELIAKWKANVSSPVAGCASGEIDDIISTNELRARICSALLMLSSKGRFGF